MLGRNGHYETRKDAMRTAMRLRREGVLIVIVHRCRLEGACEK